MTFSHWSGCAPAVRPNDAVARTLLAQAYLQLGETGHARSEIASVQGQDLPPEARKTIERFMNSIDQLSDTGKARLDGYVDAALGYDTNVNDLIRRYSRWRFPPSGGLVAESAELVQRRAYRVCQPGRWGERDCPVNAGMSLVGGASVYGKFDENSSQYNTGTTDLNGGAVWRHRREVFGLTADYNTATVDQARYRLVTGVMGQWQHNFDSQTKSILFVQDAQIRYPGQGVLNIDRTTLGVTGVRALRGFNTVFYGGVYAGRGGTIGILPPRMSGTIFMARAAACKPSCAPIWPCLPT